MKDTDSKGLNISIRCFITAIGVIFALMVGAYILTFLIPGGEYARIENDSGRMIIDTAKGFSYVEGGISFIRWLLSPILVLTAEGSGTLIAVIIFLLVIGGVFQSLTVCGLMNYMLDKIAYKYISKKYSLLTVITLFFMTMGALIGSFEEVVPMVPIVVALSVSLGWDKLTGIAMSILAAGCGFASGVCNPFTVGVAQELSGLPMFSGIWLRLLSFALIYLLLLWFLSTYAKKTEKAGINTEKVFIQEKSKENGLLSFVIIIGIGLTLVISSGLIPALQDYTLIIVAIMFLVAGIISPAVTGMEKKEHVKTFFDGVKTILPGAAMILMAASVKYTLEEANVLDTMLYYAVGVAGNLPKWAVVLFIYLIVLIMNFFIGSGSAKAFMMMPLIVPLAELFGISSQLCVVAFAFGDGFSNALYPTNAALLISLGLADVSYTEWFRWSWKFQFLNLFLTCGILMLGLAVGYC